MATAYYKTIPKFARKTDGNNKKPQLDSKTAPEIRVGFLQRYL